MASGADTICSARVMRNAYLPELVTPLSSVTPTTSIPPPWLVPLFQRRPLRCPAGCRTFTRRTQGTPPAADLLPASRWAPWAWCARLAPLPLRHGHAHDAVFDPLAPVWFADVSGYPDTMSDASVSDAYVFRRPAGVAAVWLRPAWRPVGRVYFKSSSIDLEAVTGISRHERRNPTHLEPLDDPPEFVGLRRTGHRIVYGMMRYGYIRIFSGTQPTDADQRAGHYLGKITEGGNDYTWLHSGALDLQAGPVAAPARCARQPGTHRREHRHRRLVAFCLERRRQRNRQRVCPARRRVDGRGPDPAEQRPDRGRCS